MARSIVVRSPGTTPFPAPHKCPRKLPRDAANIVLESTIPPPPISHSPTSLRPGSPSPPPCAPFRRVPALARSFQIRNTTRAHDTWNLVFDGRVGWYQNREVGGSGLEGGLPLPRNPFRKRGTIPAGESRPTRTRKQVAVQVAPRRLIRRTGVPHRTTGHDTKPIDSPAPTPRCHSPSFSGKFHSFGTSLPGVVGSIPTPGHHVFFCTHAAPGFARDPVIPVPVPVLSVANRSTAARRWLRAREGPPRLVGRDTRSPSARDISALHHVVSEPRARTMLRAFELFRSAGKNEAARTTGAQCAGDPDGHCRGVPGDRHLRPGAWVCGCVSLCPRGYAAAVVHGHRIDHDACVRWTISSTSSAIRSKRWWTSRPTVASTSANFSGSFCWSAALSTLLLMGNRRYFSFQM